MQFISTLNLRKVYRIGVGVGVLVTVGVGVAVRVGVGVGVFVGVGVTVGVGVGSKHPVAIVTLPVTKVRPDMFWLHPLTI